jgi:O-antigen ligase
LAFARAFFLAGDSRRARVLLLAIAVSGATIALAAIVLLLLNLAPNFGRASILYRNNLTGPFINRNVAATYWGTCSLIWLVLLMQIMTEHLRGTQGWRSLLFRITAKAPLRAVASALGFLVCSGATAMTGSRGGLLITATLSMAIPPVWLYRHSLLRSGWIVPAIALVVLGIILQIAGGAVSQRIDVAGLSDDFRFQTYLATLTMIADHPWLGIGLGSFETVFPSYRTAALGSFGVWDHAHNSLLELTAELGIPIGVIVLLTALYFGACLVRGVLTRRRDLIFPLAGLVVGLLGCLHSMVDFPLQQPGYAVVFAAVVACGLAQCDRRSAPARSEPLALH